MISMKEIGRICGIAESTVSKALNGRPGIKAETRNRVIEVAAKYGYQPNAMVECMQTGRSRSIGIACNNFQDPFTGLALDGVHETLHQFGYDSYVIRWDKLVEDHAELLSRFARRRVDGLLLFPTARPPEQSHIAQLHAFHNPVVLIDQLWRGGEFDYVGSDNRGGMAALVELLISQGFRKIGAVTYPGVSSGEERKQGFLDTMFKYNLPVDARSLLEIRDAREAYVEIRKLLAGDARPEALLCFNDFFATDALNAALDLGLRVPEDLAVTGFGNLPFAEKLRPHLTSVDQRIFELGERAARLLLDRIDGRETGPRRRIILPATPVIRDSSRLPLIHNRRTAL